MVTVKNNKKEKNCGQKYCIKKGDKSELIREINIRLAGFGGNVPTDEFTDRTEKMIKQFQRDYMKVAETGKICGNVLKAIDLFSSKYDISSTIWEQLKCNCSTKGQQTVSKLRGIKELNKCDGFGDSTGKNTNLEKYNKYEFSGIHRSLLFGLKALFFYLEQQEKYQLAHITSGYRCRFKNYKTTNHQGKAIDIQFNKGNWNIRGNNSKNLNALEDIRSNFFEKYLDAKTNWTNNDFFSLEPIGQGSGQTYSWIHMDVREFEKKHLNDKYFCKNSSSLNGESMVILAEKLGFNNTCNCIGTSKTSTPKLIEKCTKCKTLLNTYRGEEREIYYRVIGTKMIRSFSSKNSNCNKFKALYMIAQRRQENNFKIDTIGNNPMNLKGSGDLGQTEPLNTGETINGNYKKIKDRFAKFSTEEKGFQKYYDYLLTNWPDAYKALIGDSKTITDFVSGLEDTGKYGAYATGEASNSTSGTEQYKKAIIEMFKGVLADYKKWYNCMLTCPSLSDKKSDIKKDIELLNKLK